MNGNEGIDLERLTGGHNLAFREALGTYARAKGIELGIERAWDAVVRQLAEARAETFEAWKTLNGAFDEEALPDGEGES